LDVSTLSRRVNFFFIRFNALENLDGSVLLVVESFVFDDDVLVRPSSHPLVFEARLLVVMVVGVGVGRIVSSDILVNMGADAVEHRMLFILIKLLFITSVSLCVSHAGS